MNENEVEQIPVEETEMPPEEQPVSLPVHLKVIAQDLIAVSRHSNDPDQKAEFFKGIRNELELVGEELQMDMETFEEEAPEKIRKIVQDIDKNLLECQNLFLDAIENMLDFTETEDPQLIENANESIGEAEELMKKGDYLQRELEELLG